MSVQLNHTIVSCRDQNRSAAFLAGIAASLARPEPTARDQFDDEKLRTWLGVGAE